MDKILNFIDRITTNIPEFIEKIGNILIKAINTYKITYEFLINKWKWNHSISYVIAGVISIIFFGISIFISFLLLGIIIKKIIEIIADGRL